MTKQLDTRGHTPVRLRWGARRRATSAGAVVRTLFTLPPGAHLVQDVGAWDCDWASDRLRESASVGKCGWWDNRRDLELKPVEMLPLVLDSLSKDSSVTGCALQAKIFRGRPREQRTSSDFSWRQLRRIGGGDGAAGQLQDKGSAFKEGRIPEETKLWWRKPTAINRELGTLALVSDGSIQGSLGWAGILQNQPRFHAQERPC